MKHELVKTENYLLVVDDSEIKVGDWVYNQVSKEMYRFNENLVNYEKKVIAHLPINDSADLKRVLLLPPLEDEDDVEKLAHSWVIMQTTRSTDYWDARVSAYTQGYNKAREKDKFTEEDIEKAIAYGLNCKRMDAGEIPYMTMGDFYESLSRPKIPIAFEMEMGTKYFEDSRWETHPILVDNKEGQTILLGTYIYE